jgi:hypothetical protein
MYFKYKYHSEVVSCGITEAIEDEVLPEPEILLFPLRLDNTIASETWEINPKSKGPIVYDEYKNIWKYKGKKIHAKGFKSKAGKQFEADIVLNKSTGKVEFDFSSSQNNFKKKD